MDSAELHWKSSLFAKNSVSPWIKLLERGKCPLPCLMLHAPPPSFKGLHFLLGHGRGSDLERGRDLGRSCDFGCVGMVRALLTAFHLGKQS